jgi:hypothetical protein
MKVICNVLTAFLVGAILSLVPTGKPTVASPDKCAPDRIVVLGRIDAVLHNGRRIKVTVCDPPDNAMPNVYCCIPIETE